MTTPSPEALAVAQRLVDDEIAAGRLARLPGGALVRTQAVECPNCATVFPVREITTRAETP